MSPFRHNFLKFSSIFDFFFCYFFYTSLFCTVLNCAVRSLQSPQILSPPGGIFINQGRTVIELLVNNTADRPIQIGSHYHFIESNPLLEFDRMKSYGMRLNIAAGTAIR